jgi:hypothetical protein
MFVRRALSFSAVQASKDAPVGSEPAGLLTKVNLLLLLATILLACSMYTCSGVARFIHCNKLQSVVLL